MSAITRFVDNVPVYDEDYVYLNDWMKVEGYEFDEETDEDQKETIKEEFYEWAEDNGLTAQDC